MATFLKSPPAVGSGSRKDLPEMEMSKDTIDVLIEQSHCAYACMYMQLP